MRPTNERRHLSLARHIHKMIPVWWDSCCWKTWLQFCRLHFKMHFMKKVFVIWFKFNCVLNWCWAIICWANIYIYIYMYHMYVSYVSFSSISIYFSMIWLPGGSYICRGQHFMCIICALIFSGHFWNVSSGYCVTKQFFKIRWKCHFAAIFWP